MRSRWWRELGKRRVDVVEIGCRMHGCKCCSSREYEGCGIGGPVGFLLQIQPSFNDAKHAKPRLGRVWYADDAELVVCSRGVADQGTRSL